MTAILTKRNFILLSLLLALFLCTSSQKKFLYVTLPELPINASFLITPSSYDKTILPFRLPKYKNLIIDASIKYKIPLYLLCRMIDWESGFNANLITPNSDSEDRGLMALNSKNDKYFARIYNKGKSFNPLDPEANLRIGCQYLYDCFIITGGNWIEAIVKYNGGNAYYTRNIKECTLQYLTEVFDTNYTFMINYLNLDKKKYKSLLKRAKEWI